MTVVQPLKGDAPTKSASAGGGDVAINCNVSKIYYGAFLAVARRARADSQRQDHRLHRSIRLR